MKSMISALALSVALVAAPAMAQVAAPTAADAKAFVADAEAKLLAQSNRAQKVYWINNTYITEDTDALAAQQGEEDTKLQVSLALAAAKYDKAVGLDAETKRKLLMLRTGLVLPAPTRDGAAAELATISTKLGSLYGKGKGTLRDQPISGSDIEAEMGTNRNPEELKEMWASWHDNVGKPMKADYVKLVSIANEGARELGFADTGALWRSNYDMPVEQFGRTMDQLWLDVKPLYDELHTFVRGKLNAKYGDAVQPKTGAIRADLLGNMWAQEWGGIYDLVAPPGAGDIGYDIGELLTAKGKTPIDMVKYGEGFFTSLGLDPLPETFYTRSMFVKPADREVICHASAWDLDNKDDLRIKMCIKVNSDDFITVHHELGHNYYQRAYQDQSYLHLNGANDGFHEAIGDMLALSITPDYLVQIGLLDPAKVPGADKDTGLLLRQAMDKVAFLPFGLLSGQMALGRVFSGDDRSPSVIIRRIGLPCVCAIRASSAAGGSSQATAFDPGARSITFLATRLTPATSLRASSSSNSTRRRAEQSAGWKGPLHRCSFYGNKVVGANG